MTKYKILQGHVTDVLKTLPANSVHCVVTSPPYFGLRDYGTAEWEGGDSTCAHEGTEVRTAPPGTHKQASNKGSVGVRSGDCWKCGAKRKDSQIGLEPTPEDYVADLVEVFREVRRVLREDGTVWLNLGDSYCGSRVNDGTVNPGISQDRKRGQLAGTTRPNTKIDGLKQKDLVGIPWRVAFALQADGWFLRNDIIWHKPNPMPESVTDRCTRSHEYIFLLSKNGYYFYDADAIREPHAREWDATNGGNLSPAGNHKANGKRRERGGNYPKPNPLGRNKRTVWTITTYAYEGAHFATFPVELPEVCILAGTSEHGCCPQCGSPWIRIVDKTEYQPDEVEPGERRVDASRADKTRKLSGAEYNKTVRILGQGWAPTCTCYGFSPDDLPEYLTDATEEERASILTRRINKLQEWATLPVVPCTVMDIFCGSGTTGMVAVSHKREFIGIELNPEYVVLGHTRILEGDKRLPELTEELPF